MLVRAYIVIELLNGSRLKYVRDAVTNGIAKQYYTYTNETGDKLINQTGAGKIYGDYTSLITSLEDTNKYMSFPESGGSTKFLIRDNTDVGKGMTVTNYIAKTAVSRIFIIEEIQKTGNEI